MKRKLKCGLELFCCFSCPGLSSFGLLRGSLCPGWVPWGAGQPLALSSCLGTLGIGTHRPIQGTNTTAQPRAQLGPCWEYVGMWKQSQGLTISQWRSIIFHRVTPQPDTNSPCFRIGPLVFYENKCLFYCHKNHSASVNESLFPVGIILCTWTLSSFWSSRLGFKNNFNFIASMGRASQ